MSDRPTLRETFGDLDVYLFDQLLRGRIGAGDTVLDAGCGAGRNILHLLRAGADVHALDSDPGAVAHVRQRAARDAPHLSADNFRVESLEDHSFPDGFADAVLCIAVLHFARDVDHFRAMLDGAWRAVRPGGLLFARLASNATMEADTGPAGRRARLPDGSERFITDAAFLEAERERLGAELADPLKTVVVHGLRGMSVWVLRRPAPDQSRGPGMLQMDGGPSRSPTK